MCGVRRLAGPPWGGRRSVWRRFGAQWPGRCCGGEAACWPRPSARAPIIRAPALGPGSVVGPNFEVRGPAFHHPASSTEVVALRPEPPRAWPLLACFAPVGWWVVGVLCGLCRWVGGWVGSGVDGRGGRCLLGRCAETAPHVMVSVEAPAHSYSDHSGPTYQRHSCYESASRVCPRACECECGFGKHM